MDYKLKNIELKPIDFEYVDKITEYLQNPNIHKNTLKIPNPYSREDAEYFVESRIEMRNDGSEYAFAIIYDNQFVGVICLKDLNYKFKRAEIGYWIAEEFWGKGIMTVALNKLLEFGFKDLDLNKIFAEIFVENIGSQRVVEKQGFKYEGTLREHFLKDNIFLDVKIYSLLKKEWKRFTE